VLSPGVSADSRSRYIPVRDTTLAKGIEILAYEITLLLAEVRTLRVANEVLSKRCRAKKTRVRQGGALTIEDT
jgi:hypothetical protein